MRVTASGKEPLGKRQLLRIAEWSGYAYPGITRDYPMLDVELVVGTVLSVEATESRLRPEYSGRDPGIERIEAAVMGLNGVVATIADVGQARHANPHRQREE